MDVLTQLDAEVDLLLKIMSSSIAYVSRKAQHQVLPHDGGGGSSVDAVPLTILGQTEAISPQEMKHSVAELVTDLVTKALEIKSIILHLPVEKDPDNDTHLQSDLHQLESDLHSANLEYQSACTQAAQLHTTITALLAQLSAHQQDVTAWLASTATT